MTLMAIYNGEVCIGRCDAKCYEATTPECVCICRGANHGMGRQQALKNTRAMAERWLDPYLKRYKGKEIKGEVAPAVHQRDLFTEAG